ncbi:hypothetical protein [Thermophilibacter provencensis]|uniref:hypothetical protein n=1 Tax=Thermophilibacter provencensis TaxID=1852386 RepID=UPI003AA9B992
MRVPPIPRMMRQEAVTVWRQRPEGGFSASVEVPRCRVDRSGRLSPNDYQLTPGCSARVFIDATEYRGELAEGDLVGFDGERHAVASVSRCDHPDGTPHHWEADVA